jgi:hypothetical protein
VNIGELFFKLAIENDREFRGEVEQIASGAGDDAGKSLGKRTGEGLKTGVTGAAREAGADAGRTIGDQSARGLTSGITKAAGPAGTEAGRTMGQKIGDGFKRFAGPGLKIAAGALSAGFAIATKEGLELNTTLNELQTETGATGDDWTAMSQVVRRENGRTTESLDGIREAVRVMRSDLGLSGDDIQKYSDRMFDAGQVSKTSGAVIASAADDIGDAWEVDVGRSLDAVDQLIVSRQRFGGSLEARLAALPGFARPLRALGGDINDAIALMNGAAASGLDFSVVQRALNSAVGKFRTPPDLKTLIGAKAITKKTPVAVLNGDIKALEGELKKLLPPNEFTAVLAQVKDAKTPYDALVILQGKYNDALKRVPKDPINDLLKTLSQVPDQQARVQRALQMGLDPKSAQTWATLAGKIRESGDIAKTFGITVKESTGAAVDGAKNLNRDGGRQIDLFIENIKARLADLGDNPALTGLASLGTIVGGFAPELGPSIFRAARSGLTGIGRRLLPLLGVEMAVAGTGAGVAAAAAEVTAETTGVVAGQAAVAAAATGPAAAGGAAIGTAMGEGAAAAAGGASIGARIASGFGGLGGAVGKAFVGGFVLYVAANLADQLRQPVEDAGATAHSFLPEWLKRPGELLRQATGNTADLSWPFGHKNEPNWDDLFSKPQNILDQLGFALGHIGQDATPVDPEHLVPDLSPQLSQAEKLAIQLSKLSPDQRQQAMSHGAYLTFQHDATTYADALAGAQAKQDVFLAGLGKIPDELAGVPREFLSAAQQSAAAFTGLPAETAGVPNEFLTQSQQSAKNLKDPVVAAAHESAAAVAGIPDETAGVPNEFFQQASFMGFNLKTPIASAAHGAAAAVRGIPAETSGVPNEFGVQGRTAAANFAHPIKGATSSAASAAAAAASRAVQAASGAAANAKRIALVALSNILTTAKQVLSVLFDVGRAATRSGSEGRRPTGRSGQRAFASGGVAPMFEWSDVGEEGLERIFPTPFGVRVVPRRPAVPTFRMPRLSLPQPMALAGAAVPAGGDTYHVTMPSNTRSDVTPADVMRDLRRFGEMGLLPKRRRRP